MSTSITRRRTRSRRQVCRVRPAAGTRRSRRMQRDGQHVDISTPTAGSPPAAQPSTRRNGPRLRLDARRGGMCEPGRGRDRLGADDLVHVHRARLRARRSACPSTAPRVMRCTAGARRRSPRGTTRARPCRPSRPRPRSACCWRSGQTAAAVGVQGAGELDGSAHRQALSAGGRGRLHAAPRGSRGARRGPGHDQGRPDRRRDHHHADRLGPGELRRPGLPRHARHDRRRRAPDDDQHGADRIVRARRRGRRDAVQLGDGGARGAGDRLAQLRARQPPAHGGASTCTRTSAARCTAAWPRETSRTDAAISATAGEAVTYHGTIVPAFFFSSSGGHTESINDAWGGPAVPYLVGVPDPYDGISPMDPWRAPPTYTGTRLGQLLGLGAPVTQIAIISRGTSPRVRMTRITLAGGRAVDVSGAAIQDALGLPSTWFVPVASGGSGPRAGAHGDADPDRRLRRHPLHVLALAARGRRADRPKPSTIPARSPRSSPAARMRGRAPP